MEQNFNLYHIFYTVAKCRNISGAARELYISQPAISKAISKLEQSLGTTLFYRSSRGVSLTEPGEILFAQVENAFQAITQGEEQLQRFQKLGMGHLSIGGESLSLKSPRKQTWQKQLNETIVTKNKSGRTEVNECI